MSLLSVAPDMVSAASGNLANVGSTLRSAAAAAATQTTAIAAPAGDEVSAAITALLGTHAQEFQTLNGQAAAFHDQFVNLLNSGAQQYVSTEVANAQQTLANAVNTPAQAAAGATAADPTDPIGPVFDNSGALTLNYPFGPFGFSLSATPVFLSDGLGGSFLSGLIGTGAVTYSTPLGSGVLASANISEGFVGNGGFYGHILETWPLGSWTTVDATGLFSPYPTLTGLAYNFDGLEISLPGTGLLGPIVPNVTWNPTP